AVVARLVVGASTAGQHHRGRGHHGGDRGQPLPPVHATSPLAPPGTYLLRRTLVRRNPLRQWAGRPKRRDRTAGNRPDGSWRRAESGHFTTKERPTSGRAPFSVVR